MKAYIILLLFSFGILSCETAPEVELFNEIEAEVADEPEVELSCGPFKPFDNGFPPDVEAYDTTFFHYQEGLNLELSKCFHNSSYPGYSITGGDKIIFMFYFSWKPQSGPADAFHEKTLLFETPADIGTYYIDNSEFCDHQVFFRGNGPFGIINNELVNGPGCISIKKVDDFARKSEDVYEVSINLPLKKDDDSTFQIQFTEQFTKAELLNK